MPEWATFNAKSVLVGQKPIGNFVIKTQHGQTYLNKKLKDMNNYYNFRE